jgi:hypothetical protein
MAQYLIPILFVMIVITLYIIREIQVFHRGGDVYDWTKQLALFLMPLSAYAQQALFAITFIIVLSVIVLLIKAIMIMASLGAMG